MIFKALEILGHTVEAEKRSPLVVWWLSTDAGEVRPDTRWQLKLDSLLTVTVWRAHDGYWVTVNGFVSTEPYPTPEAAAEAAREQVKYLAQGLWRNSVALLASLASEAHE